MTAPAPPAAPQPQHAQPAQPASGVQARPYVPAARQSAEHATPARTRRSLTRAGTPGVLRLLLIGLVAASVVWGAVGAWTVSQHASAASEVVAASEPLSLAAQQMYQSLSDADVTATTAILAGPPEVLTTRVRYDGDIENAAADLAHLRGTAAGSAQLTADLTDVSTGLAVYAKYAQEALSSSAAGQPLAAGSYMEDASDVMHLTLLPAASAIYAQQRAALTAASAQATGLPWIIVTVLLALGIGFTLLRSQRWLTRRTHRTINSGLLVATAAILISTIWLVAGFLSARSDFSEGLGHGSTPAEELAQSVIAAQQARGDQVLNLISRTGSTSFSADFAAESATIGPRPGSLLTTAIASSPTGTGAVEATAAERAATAWYSVSAQVFRLDAAHQYAAETARVIGTGPGSSGPGFTALVDHLRRGISADQAVFKSNAAAGSGAFGGLEAGVIIAALLMAAGCTWGLSRRLAEYR